MVQFYSSQQNFSCPKVSFKIVHQIKRKRKFGSNLDSCRWRIECILKNWEREREKKESIWLSVCLSFSLLKNNFPLSTTFERRATKYHFYNWTKTLSSSRWSPRARNSITTTTIDSLSPSLFLFARRYSDINLIMAPQYRSPLFRRSQTLALMIDFLLLNFHPLLFIEWIGAPSPNSPPPPLPLLVAH